MSLRWQEIALVPEGEEDVPCEGCGLPAVRVEGRLAHQEAHLARYAVRWRPDDPWHPGRHVLYLGDWTGRDGTGSGADARVVAVADYRGGPDHGFTLRDDAAALTRALDPWRPHRVRRAEAIGRPLGERLFAMLDAIHVKDPRLAAMRAWAGLEPRPDRP